MQNTLNKLTTHVRKTQGSGEALRFYVNFIQPIMEYFGGDDKIKKINLSTDEQQSPELNVSDTNDGDFKKVYVMSDENHQVVGVVSDFENQNLVKTILHKCFGSDVIITYNEQYKEYEVKAINNDDFDPYLISIEEVCYFI